MEQTITNMSLIIKNVKDELKNNGFNESKTLMNTYRTLLKRFTSLQETDSTIDSHRTLLENQREQLLSIHERIEKQINLSIANREYKNADTLAETSRRLECSASDIEKLILNRNKHVKRMHRLTLLNENRNKN